MDLDMVCPVLLPSRGISHVFNYLEDGKKKHFSFFVFSFTNIILLTSL